MLNSAGLLSRSGDQYKSLSSMPSDWQLLKFFPALKTQTSQKLARIKGILTGFV
jgi:hypothetical protein